MTTHWSLPAWLVVLCVVLVAAVLVALVVSLRRGRKRSAVAIDALTTQVAAIEERLNQTAARESAGAAARTDDTEYTITTLGTPEPDGAQVEPAPVVPAPVFADLVLRESVVQAASFAAGLRRALAPETRNRIRFAMKREVKRARKQRRADLKQARREWEARRDTAPLAGEAGQPVASR